MITKPHASARIVFDLDGTLIDSAPDIHAIANKVLVGERAAPISLAETRSFVGKGAAVFVARMRGARGVPEAAQTRMLTSFVSLYDKAVDLTTIYPGVTEVLAALKDAGHRLGICTNKPISPARSVLSHLGLSELFEVVIGGDSLIVRKPDPAPLEAAFEALGSGPMIYVGDSEVDAETSLRAEVPFLLFTEGYRKSPVADLPHHSAFSVFESLPGLVTRVLN